MSSSSYQPTPLGTSQTELPEAVELLIERLAENNHDVWADKRMAEGWTWGPERDDQHKTHPCLVAYSDLPESEKEYDRATVRSTIQAMLSLGYEIEPQTGGTENSFARMNPITEFISTEGDLNLASTEQLRRLWSDRNPDDWNWFPDSFQRLAKVLKNRGLPFLAYDVATEGLCVTPSSTTLKQLQALTLAQTGSPLAAQRILQSLVDAGHSDSETLGILARTFKDLARAASDEDERRRHLTTAYSHYANAFERNNEYYPGINAATLSILLGEREQAEQIASRVKELCLKQLKDNGEDYWCLATLGEASLILNKLDDAQDHYRRAVEIAAHDIENIRSTHRQAVQLLHALGMEESLLNEIFPAPNIVVFTGHRMDGKDRRSPRFPREQEAVVKREIAEQIAEWGANIGFASAASGADILFLEAVLERQGSIHIILPVQTDEFKQTSVLANAEESWEKRFDDVLAKATSVICLSDEIGADDGTPYDYANQVLLGAAKLHAHRLNAMLKSLAVWDGHPGDGQGGTADCVSRWKGAGMEVTVIPPMSNAAKMESTPSPINPSPIIKQEIKAALFADVVGYSKLTEAEIPTYLKHFMANAGELCATSPHKPEVKNTWGDAFYFVFPSATDAGLFALRLREFVTGTDWSGLGLSRTLKIRIALHAGPLFPLTDPVTLQPTYTGSHVSRTARIEPIAEENQIFASQPFAALAAFENATGLDFTYAGERPLAKKYGNDMLFIMQAAESSE